MILKCANPACDEYFKQIHKGHMVCGDPACKKWYYNRDKAEKQALTVKSRPEFTQTMKELIVECLEFRKQLSLKYIAGQISSNAAAVQAEIERMKETGEYDKYRAIVRLQRGRA